MPLASRSIDPMGHFIINIYNQLQEETSSSSNNNMEGTIMRRKSYRIVKLILGILCFVLLASTKALAVPLVTPTVTNLGGGIFSYSYELTNPAGSMENIFDFGIFFVGDPNNVAIPAGWDAIFGTGFIDWFSTDTPYDLAVGAPPLSGFYFESSFGSGDILFTIQGADPFACDPALCGITAGPVSSSVPEPMTLLLLGAGLTAMVMLRKWSKESVVCSTSLFNQNR